MTMTEEGGMLNCETCHGTGNEEYWDDDSDSYRERNCTACGGTGQVNEPEDEMGLQSIVDRNMDVAVRDNGYAELVTMSPEDVAIDLCTYSQELEYLDIADVAACVSVWQVSHKQHEHANPPAEYTDWPDRQQENVQMTKPMSESMDDDLDEGGTAPDDESRFDYTGVAHLTPGGPRGPQEVGDPEEDETDGSDEEFTGPDGLVDCETCNTTGYINHELCPDCGGSGYERDRDENGEPIEPGAGLPGVQRENDDLDEADAAPTTSTPPPPTNTPSSTPSSTPPTPTPPMPKTESTQFDKFMDRAALDEARTRKVDLPENNPMRRLAKNYQERPLGRIRFVKRGA